MPGMVTSSAPGIAVAMSDAAGGGLMGSAERLDHEGGDRDRRQLGAPVQAALVRAGVRGRVVVPPGVVDDALLQPTELVAVERHLVAVENAPVLDAERDLLLAGAGLGESLPQREQARIDVAERRRSPSGPAPSSTAVARIVAESSRSGESSRSSCTSVPPMDMPTTWARSMPSPSRTATASRARSATAYGRWSNAQVDRPVSRWS